MSPTADILTTMAQAGSNAVAAAFGANIAVTPPTEVPLESAFGAVGTVIKRSQLSSGQNIAGLITIVPSSGLVSAEVAIDAAQLTDALIHGAVSGIAQVGGPLLQVAAPQHVSTASGVDAAGAQAFAFELTTGARSITVIWVVEATLGSLIGSAIPVDGAAPGGPSVAPATLPELSRVGAHAGDRDLRILSDVVTKVSVEIARGSVQVRDLTSMASGSVFELDREAGDPVDILVNGSIVAKGDIIVVGNSLGVRITELVEPHA